jgi:hypothetical protein
MRDPARGWLFVVAACASFPAVPGQTEDLQSGQSTVVANVLGDTSAELVYTPIAPCRIIDTRLGGGPIGADTTRDFVVAGTEHFAEQGGHPGGCGVPEGAVSAMVNFVAVSPTGPGDLRAAPFGAPMPLASVLNWAAIPGLNIANGLAVKLCDPTATTCTSDMTLQADASTVDIVGDVQGYYVKANLAAAMPAGSENPAPFMATTTETYSYATAHVMLPKGGACLVTCQLTLVTSPGALTMGQGFFATTQENVENGLRSTNPGGGELTVPATRTSGTVAYVWPMTHSTRYRFGCYLYATENFLGKMYTPVVSWICR